jgi:hypothetical protein
MKTLLLFVALIVFNLVFFGGRHFDRVCIEGRISEAQAEAINELPWKKCAGGTCEADLNDRVIARECSEFLRKWALRDVL